MFHLAIPVEHFEAAIYQAFVFLVMFFAISWKARRDKDRDIEQFFRLWNGYIEGVQKVVNSFTSDGEMEVEPDAEGEDHGTWNE